MMDLTPSEISDYYRVRVPGLRKAGESLRGRCPVHQGDDPNFSVDPSTGMACCHSQCGRGWDVAGLEMELTAQPFPQAKEEIYRIIGRPKPSWEEKEYESIFEYHDESGAVQYRVVRKRVSVEKKDFFQQHLKDGKWCRGLGGKTQIPYRLPQLLDPMAKVVAYMEGEKCVQAMIRAGWVATCNSGGARKAPLSPEFCAYFTGKHVAVFPDNDEPGRIHAKFVAQSLSPVAASVRIVEIPGLGLKGDAFDFLIAGGTGVQLRNMYRNAEDWTPEWEFTNNVPHENDKFLRTFGQAVEEAGGVDGFWASLTVDGLPTPYPKLTRCLGGLRKGEVYVIGARSGQGKTSLALQFAAEVLPKKVGVLIFSMEMGHRDAFQRIAASDAMVDLSTYRRLIKSDPDCPIVIQYKDALNRATAKFQKLPLYVTTKTSVTLEFLKEEAMRIMDRAKLGLIIIDHMQLMGSTGKRISDYEKFTAISRAIKEVAVELKVPVILVSQVSRNNAADKRTELEMWDLRGSGAIEEDAAAILLLYYDADDFAAAKAESDGTRLAKGPIKTWLKLAKNRFGAAGVYECLNHWKSITRFDLVDEQGS